MATKNAIDSNIPIEISLGGTAVVSNTAYSPLAGGTTSTGPIQSIGTGNSTEVLTSLGAASLPAWLNLPTFFQSLASDPASPTTGQVWYNTTSHLFKGAKPGAAVWTAKASMNTARQQFGGSLDSASDALSFGGQTTVAVTTTERYSGGGDSWTAKTGLNRATFGNAGAGSAADALSFGGNDGVVRKYTERYDGTGNTWTNKTDLNNANTYLAGAGTAADGLAMGGFDGAVELKTTERYDGTGNTWTNKTNLNTARSRASRAGTASSALTSGGSAIISSTEIYDGTGNTWTNEANMNTARGYLAGCGTTSAALAFGGFTGLVSAVTELYDAGAGNSWATVNPLNTARYGLAGSGTYTDALSYGGFTVVNVGTTERYQSASTIVTFTT